MKPFFPAFAGSALATALLLAACSSPSATRTAPPHPTTVTTPAGAATEVPEPSPQKPRHPAPAATELGRTRQDARQEQAINSLFADEAVATGAARKMAVAPMAPPPGMVAQNVAWPAAMPAESREKYQHLAENPVQLATQNSLSTLSLDVDTGSYANVRRFLNQGQLPPRDAVRVEELLNYFSYDYPAPAGGHPFSVGTEVARAP